MRPDAAADEFKALVADEEPERDAYRSTAPCDSFELGPQTEDGRPPCAHRNIAPSPPPALAALRSVELPIGTTSRFTTTPDDVHPGHCVRLAVDVPTTGVLAVDAHHVGDSHLTALYLSQRAYARCPLPAEAADHAAAETTPSRTGYVSLAACAEEPGRRWYVYAAGPVTGFATFNVSARVGAPCALAAPAPELGPISAADVGFALGVSFGALAVAFALAWRFSYRVRSRLRKDDEGVDPDVVSPPTSGW